MTASEWLATALLHRVLTGELLPDEDATRPALAEVQY